MSRNAKLVTIHFNDGDVELPVVVKLTDTKTGKEVSRLRDWVVGHVNKKNGGNFSQFIKTYTARHRNKAKKATKGRATARKAVKARAGRPAASKTRKGRTATKTSKGRAYRV